MADTKLSVNGIAVLVEYEDRLRTPLRRASSGTWIVQDRDSWNWFHFTTGTPVEDRDQDVELAKVRLDGTLDGARIEKVHLRAGNSLVWRIEDDIWGPTSGGFHLSYPTGTSFRYLPDAEREAIERMGHGGYVLSVKVTFTGDPGRIKFAWATFRYKV